MDGLSLDAIGLSSGTDKSSAHHDLLRHYQVQLAQNRTRIAKLLEIGVFDGASLRMWQAFLPEAQIVSVDVDPRCLAFAGGNATVELCDQSDVCQLSDLARRHAPFDVIVDDGSHIWSHQILTFETLFPYVVPGGLFIIEHTETSFGNYMSAYGRDSTLSAAQYVTKVANHLMGWSAIDLGQECDLRLRGLASQIESVTLIRRSVMIRRR